MNNMDRSTYKYVYDPHWANYLVLHGAVVTGIGINKRTSKIFVAFDYNSTKKAYEHYYSSKNKKSM